MRLVWLVSGAQLREKVLINHQTNHLLTWFWYFGSYLHITTGQHSLKTLHLEPLLFRWRRLRGNCTAVVYPGWKLFSCFWEELDGSTWINISSSWKFWEVKLDGLKLWQTLRLTHKFRPRPEMWLFEEPLFYNDFVKNSTLSLAAMHNHIHAQTKLVLLNQTILHKPWSRCWATSHTS